MGSFGNIILVDTESPVHGIAGPTFQQGCCPEKYIPAWLKVHTAAGQARCHEWRNESRQDATAKVDLIRRLCWKLAKGFAQKPSRICSSRLQVVQGMLARDSHCYRWEEKRGLKFNK